LALEKRFKKKLDDFVESFDRETWEALLAEDQQHLPSGVLAKSDKK